MLSRIDRLKIEKCTDEQRRSDDQDEREGHFADHKHGAKPGAAKAHPATAAAFIQGSCEIGPGSADGWDQAKENPGEDRNAQREEQDMQIEGNGRGIFADARKTSRAGA